MLRLLAANRNGKLDGDQWRELVLEPLMPLLFLLLPAVLFFGPRLALFSWRVGLVLIVGVVGWLLYRAWRYARLPVYEAVLYLSEEVVGTWKVWKPPVMQTKKGGQISFGRRVAPRMGLKRDVAYRVYYLRDGMRNVLLSVAPVEHPQAVLWQPGSQFEERFRQRGGGPL